MVNEARRHPACRVSLIICKRSMVTKIPDGVGKKRHRETVSAFRAASEAVMRTAFTNLDYEGLTPLPSHRV